MDFTFSNLSAMLSVVSFEEKPKTARYIFCITFIRQYAAIFIPSVILLLGFFPFDYYANAINDCQVCRNLPDHLPEISMLLILLNEVILKVDTLFFQCTDQALGVITSSAQVK